MANEDPFKSRTADFFSVRRSAPQPASSERAAAKEEQDDKEEQAAADPWQRRAEEAEEAEEEAEEQRGGNPWDRPSSDSAFSAARPGGSGQSSGSSWTQVRRDLSPDDGSTSQSFAVRRYDPRSPRERENPFASKDQPPPPPRVDSSFGASSSGRTAPSPPPRKRGPEPDPPVPDNPFTSKPRENPFAGRNKRR